MSEIVPDHIHVGAFVVRSGLTEQSWVDLSDPLKLEFEYVRRIAEILEATILLRRPDERVRVVHLGGGGLTLPRYVEARRPHTAQIVLEPDVALIDQVRARLPLARHSGIKIRPMDGRTGVRELPDAYADLLIVDAFAGAQVPADLATEEFFADAARVLRPGGQLVMNLGDRAPFDWTKRCLAGLARSLPQQAVSAEVSVWKGRRYGNLVVLAGSRGLPTAALERAVARAAFPYRLVGAGSLTAWVGGAAPFTDADSRPSIDPVARGWFT
ncbi:MAG: fused MFS/spermidine synthase [Propionibacteriaceae bacterium]|nr:fused MFS/spermidine synthase [Propionibacteriaceae bacterium]